MAFSGRPLIGMAAAGVLALAGTSASAGETSFSGLWLQQHLDNRAHAAPSLTPAALSAQEEARKATRVMGVQMCLPVGMPRMMMNELPFEIVESPERVGIISEQTELARTIYLNTKTHPVNDAQPTWNGNSYGWWETGKAGKTLVVDTANFNDRTAHIPGTPKGSTTTHLTEKYWLENGGKLLVVEMTFDDPKVLAKPYTILNPYDRLPEGSQRWEYVCDTQDPGWNTALGVDPTKDK